MIVEKEVSYTTTRPRKHLCEGTFALRRAWEASRQTREAFADRIAVSASQVTALLMGYARANKPTAKICQRELGISPELWDRAVEDDAAAAAPAAPPSDPVRDALGLLAAHFNLRLVP
jgi:plasmid maintenance system antidote protein VapI